MKRIEILYNPYINRIRFRQELPQEGSDDCEWVEIESDSQLRKFQSTRCIFENCAEEILDLINKYFNTSGELMIEFIGTEVDFDVLRSAVSCCINKNPKAKEIKCVIKEKYPSSSKVLAKIREAYEQIKTEFSDYIDNNEFDEDDDRAIIGRAVLKFRDTVQAEIPVCIIGNYSVGKSALVNALIGYEILPSHANSTTAKNVLIENGREYSLRFDYKKVRYTLIIDGNKINTACDGEVDKDIIDELISGTEEYGTEEQILHQIIENLNSKTGGSGLIAEIENKVRVVVPFRKSELDTAAYSFVFIDTPGSNNSDETQKIHRENLEDLMDEQTNALPIFVMGRNSLDSNDTNDLRILLENKEAGFALQNCIIAISMSDQLVEQQLSEEMPYKIKQLVNHPTIMYVSPVAAIGEKKTDKKKWIDRAYKQIYEKKMGDIVDLDPPNYNETPCGRKMSEERIRSIPELLYASGIPSLETEINYYAYRFAEFKKCTNGRKYLLAALELADQKLREAKAQMEQDKKDKVKEQDRVRDEIKRKINAVPLPAVNTVIAAVRADFQKVLDDYCDGIETLVRSTCEQYRDFRSIEKAIISHCQKNLYDAHIKEIKKEIEQRFVVLTADYMINVKKCVTDEFGKISDDAQKELETVFSENESGPQLRDVAAGMFERIKYNILCTIFGPSSELFIKDYSVRIRNTLKGTHSKPGEFAKQCIYRPAKQYSDQITEWSNGFKEAIDSTLNKDNAILSELDQKIKVLEARIKDMEKRLNNLSGVKQTLENILPEESKG